MKKKVLPMTTLVVVAATRTLLGVGAGLLLAPRVSESWRQRVGWALLGVGVVSTIPLAVHVKR
jgi:hypothetical protein